MSKLFNKNRFGEKIKVKIFSKNDCEALSFVTNMSE